MMSYYLRKMQEKFLLFPKSRLKKLHVYRKSPLKKFLFGDYNVGLKEQILTLPLCRAFLLTDV